MSSLDLPSEMVQRHLAPGQDLADELALFATQSADKQRVVKERLLIFDHYLGGDSQAIHAADAAAAKLGVARRRFYALIAKMREVGPVRALSPGFRNVERAAPTKDGLRKDVEALILQLFRHDPDAKISRIDEFVEQECLRKGISYPGATAIRRRVHALRRKPSAAMTGSIASEIIVDQIALDLPVKILSRTSLPVVTLVIDVGTRLILGCGLSEANDFGEGLRAALTDFQQRLPGLKPAGAEVAGTINRIRWVVPAGLEDAAERLGRDRLPEKRRPSVDVDGAGPRRHGDAIMRLLGDRLGPFQFRRNADLRYRVPAPTDDGTPFEDAIRLLHHCVDRWNREMSASSERSAEAVEGAPKRSRRLSLIQRDFEFLFAPIFDFIEVRQRNNRLRMREPGDYWS